MSIAIAAVGGLVVGAIVALLAVGWYLSRGRWYP